MPDDHAHYLNADFDVSLRSGSRSIRGSLVRQIDELSLQGLLGAAPGDAALVRADVPGAFLDHLESAGLSAPTVVRDPSRLPPRALLRPFGWSAEAIAIDRGRARTAPHPPIEVIRRVNGRSYALELERELRADDPHGRIATDLATVERIVSTRGAGDGWLLKAEHSNAALGNRRLRPGEPPERWRRVAVRRLREDGRLLVEPWLLRVRDWSTVFDVPFDDGRCRTHRPRCTADGAVVGALFDPGADDAVPAELASVARDVARRLERDGYVGPVCLDSFEWRDGERVRLRAIVDLNARHALSDGAYRAWRRAFPDRALLYRFVARRRLDAPRELAPLLEALGELRFDPRARRGVLPVAPDTAVGRLVLLVVGRDRDDVDTLDCAFDERFLKATR